MLYKVTSACHSVSVSVSVWCAGGPEFSGAWCKRGEGGARTGGSSAS